MSGENFLADFFHKKEGSFLNLFVDKIYREIKLNYNTCTYLYAVEFHLLNERHYL